MKTEVDLQINQETEQNYRKHFLRQISQNLHKNKKNSS
jgi:hypothetical protein